METASRIYSECKKQGKPIKDVGLLIAAQALALAYILATNNAKHFEGIDGLK